MHCDKKPALGGRDFNQNYSPPGGVLYIQNTDLLLKEGLDITIDIIVDTCSID